MVVVYLILVDILHLRLSFVSVGRSDLLQALDLAGHSATYSKD
jgi:hypothetical protein